MMESRSIVLTCMLLLVVSLLLPVAVPRVRASADHIDGMLTWSLDMINAEVAHGDGYEGSGVYIAVIDTGLVQNWRDYFPEERIAVEYAKAFPSGGTGQDAEVPADHWEKDTIGHGTAVTSVILGFELDGTSISGVAPKATVIPLKVETNGGVAWGSGIRAAIDYISDLKENEVIQAPIVISLTYGFLVDPGLLFLLKACIERAIGLGIVVVASGGLEPWGMAYPGAWSEVISVGCCDWTLQWIGDGDPAVPWWRDDVPEKLGGKPDSLGNKPQVYIHWSSPRKRAEQEDLDVVTPIRAVMMDGLPGGGGGTSFATPSVAGIVALMLQKDLEDGTQDLTPADVESILEETAFTIKPGTALIYQVSEFGIYGFEEDWTTVPGQFEYTSWGADATGAGLVQADAAIDAV